MNFYCPHFRSGVAWTCFIAVLAMNLNRISGFNQIGVLALALLLGIVMRMGLHIPEPQETGIHFSAKELLRIGTVLIGVKCNFDLLVHVGPRILIVAASMVLVGILFITWLGRVVGLSKTLSLLLAIDTSICGASAVASIAPVLKASKEEVALAIPLGSLIGTAGLLIMAAVVHFFQVPPLSFGVFAGASLQEVAQVIAAVSMVPASMESGIATKFLRVLFLAPAMLILGFFLTKQGSEQGCERQKRVYALVNSIWFVFGFLSVGVMHTVAKHYGNIPLIVKSDQIILAVATFLMAMAMAGVGLQVRLKYLLQQGSKALFVGLAGWMSLSLMDAFAIYFLHLK